VFSRNAHFTRGFGRPAAQFARQGAAQTS